MTSKVINACEGHLYPVLCRLPMELQDVSDRDDHCDLISLAVVSPVALLQDVSDRDDHCDVLDMQVVEARALTIGAYVHLALDRNRHTAGRFRVIAITERTVTIDYPPTRCQMTRLRSQVVRAA